ncbi:GNAT superfamily N-acetyltransferase [Aeromicrobium panaciterrae]|uniref:GNAT superfamily N-acetyltransferase n=1 Tax=Aeromicrobium panaciterrae TaxID=363861 RepID=A0ABU1UQ35_9ACTN|nr:GNAT family N-acetyltransferase [Aeromicrobium panaciterrae]MDR7087286.1 GNAT superfamily N-acetyltransferase [Aeromicrobium panaciterrae]
MTVTLQPMTPERFVSWNERLVVEYAKEKVDSGNWPAEGALERSAKENQRDLPHGLDTPGHGIFVGLSGGEEVGVLWLFTDPALKTPETMIYDIEIAEDHRGKGLGRELLTAAEEWCADHSIGLLKLHVFAKNTTAVSLYESAGFEATNINMAKIIR